MKLKKLAVALAAAFMAMLPAGKAGAQVKFLDYKTVTLQDVLKKAQAENKNVFVDIWTPWCGVCKIMDKWVFPRKEVGDYFNKNFVNLTFDAENPKWVAVAKNFNATAFPTMLVLTPKGEVILNIDNLGVPAASDAAEANAANATVSRRLMEQAGFANKLAGMSDSAFLSKETVATLAKLRPAFDTQAFMRMVRLKDAFQKQYPKEFNRLVDDALGNAAVNMVSKSGYKVNTHKAEQYRSVVNTLNLPQKQQQLLLLDLNIAVATKQWKQALALTEKNRSHMNAILYATLMDGMADGCHDKALLRSAVKLCSGATASAPSGSRLGNYLKEAYSHLEAASK